MFDAYTVKKVIPRLVAAAILIQLSWPIFTFLIYLVGQITWGIEGLLYAPFGGSEALELKNIVANMSGNTGAATATVLLIGGAGIGLVSLTLPGVLLMALSGLLALLIAFFVLTVRQLVLIILLVTAPIALAAWILPNTEKVWKVWWESFSKLLLMYPMIILLITGGKIAAKLASTANTGNVGFKVAIIFISFFGPYFLIPSTFKLAGSAFASISGIANDRSRGVFDRLKNKRQDISKEAHQNRMQGKGLLGSGKAGKIYRRGAMFGSNGSWSPTGAGRARFGAHDRKMLTQSANEMLKADEGWAAGNDDATGLASQKGMNRSGFVSAMTKKENHITGKNYTKAEANQALTEMETSFGARMGSDALRVAAFKAYSASSTGVETSMEEKAAWGNMGGALIEDGLMSTQDVAASAKANRSRSDVASAGFMDQMKFFEKGRNGGVTAADAREHTRLAYEGAEVRDIVGSHANTAEVFGEQAQLNFDQAVANGDTAAQDKAAADLANVHSQLSGTSAKKADKFARVLATTSSGIRGTRAKTQTNPATGQLEYVTQPVLDSSGKQVLGKDSAPKVEISTEERELSYREVIDDARENPTLHSAFHDRVREYSSARAANAAAAGGAQVEPTAEPPT